VGFCWADFCQQQPNAKNYQQFWTSMYLPTSPSLCSVVQRWLSPCQIHNASSGETLPSLTDATFLCWVHGDYSQIMFELFIKRRSSFLDWKLADTKGDMVVQLGQLPINYCNHPHQPIHHSQRKTLQPFSAENCWHPSENCCRSGAGDSDEVCRYAACLRSCRC